MWYKATNINKNLGFLFIDLFNNSLTFVPFLIEIQIVNYVLFYDNAINNTSVLEEVTDWLWVPPNYYNRINYAILQILIIHWSARMFLL